MTRWRVRCRLPPASAAAAHCGKWAPAGAAAVIDSS